MLLILHRWLGPSAAIGIRNLDRTKYEKIRNKYETIRKNPTKYKTRNKVHISVHFVCRDKDGVLYHAIVSDPHEGLVSFLLVEDGYAGSVSQRNDFSARLFLNSKPRLVVL
jgi:hypothetical protein